MNITMIPIGDLEPNPWNPNVMDPGMLAKERASIEAFGFVDPVTVRAHRKAYQIIDGEHRVRVAQGLGYTEIPCVILDVDEDTARELTIVLNETRGTADEPRLAALVQDLATRREASRLEALLPFDRPRLDQLLQRREIDWEELERRREQARSSRESDEAWVERVFRMPRSSASVLDDAIRKVQEEEEIAEPWRALEMIAADSLSG